MTNPLQIESPLGFKIRGYHVPVKGDYVIGAYGTAIQVTDHGEYPALVLDFDTETEYEFSNMADFLCVTVKKFKRLNKDTDCKYKYIDSEGLSYMYMRPVSK
jgi:hypothetical protein